MTQPPYPPGPTGPGDPYRPPGHGGPGYPGQGYPQQPGYPPPPPPAYPAQQGYPPPPSGYPQGAGFGGPPASRLDVGEAFRWSWSKFGANAGPLIAAFLIYLVPAGVVNYALGLSYQQSDYMSSLYGLQIIQLLVGLPYSAFAAVAIFTGVLDIADGRPVSVGSFFRPRNLGPAFVTALLLFLAVDLGFVLCIIPGFIAAALMMLAVPFAIESLAPIDAFKASYAVVRANPGEWLLTYLTAVGVVLAGALLCGVGLIVAAPVAWLILAYAYRRLSGGQVAR